MNTNYRLGKNTMVFCERNSSKNDVCPIATHEKQKHNEEEEEVDKAFKANALFRQFTRMHLCTNLFIF